MYVVQYTLHPMEKFEGLQEDNYIELPLNINF